MLLDGFCLLVGSPTVNWSWVRDTKSPSAPPRSQNWRGCLRTSAWGPSPARGHGPTLLWPTTHRKSLRGRVQCVLGQGSRPWRTDPQLPRPVTGTWNVTSLVGKEPELLHDTNRYQLDII